ncbi:MAG: VOC family protein [Halieaceae bacterium]|nr:VOC family protein [Halieaceae bacterium]
MTIDANVTSPAANSLGLGAIDQVGMVYRDLDKAIALYEPLFGPFEVFRYGDMEWEYFGATETSQIHLALAKSGDIEIELIQWISGKTPHKDFLDAGREGLHHLRYPVDDMDSKLAEAEAIGYRAAWKKRFGPGLAAVYLQREGDPLLIELFENHAGA